MAFLIKSTEEKKINLPISGDELDFVYTVVSFKTNDIIYVNVPNIMMISIDVYRNESEYKSGLNPLLSDINNGEFHVIIKDGDLIDLQTANLYAIERYENFGYKCELIP
jgi:hypothetical protein